MEFSVLCLHRRQCFLLVDDEFFAGACDCGVKHAGVLHCLRLCATAFKYGSYAVYAAVLLAWSGWLWHYLYQFFSDHLGEWSEHLQ